MEQSNEKRVKRAYKMQALLDNITMFNSKTNKKYCWRWFIILAELIHQYPESVLEEDYQPLLDLLCNYQVMRKLYFSRNSLLIILNFPEFD